MEHKKIIKIYLVIACICLLNIIHYTQNSIEYIGIAKLSREQLTEKVIFVDGLEDQLEPILNDIIAKQSVTYSYVSSDWAEIMDKPNAKSDVLDQIPFGQPVALKKSEFGWSKVLTRKGTGGWIHQADLVDSKSSEMAMLLSSRYHNRTVAVLDLVNDAKKQLGKPYVWGAVGPKSFDCSGFVQYVYRKYGIQMPRVSADQALVGDKIIFEQLMPGDLVFFDTRGDVNGNVSHVGIYIGDGSFIHASSGKAAMQVTISNFESKYYKGRFLFGRRVF